jgi:hypothetical protein
LEPEGQKQLRKSLQDMNLAVAPFVLQQAGYSSADELRQACERQLQRDLESAWGSPSWEKLQEYMVDAEVGATVAQIVNSRGWRHALQGWAGVLETMVRLAAECVEPAFERAHFQRVLALSSQERKQQTQKQAAVLGDNTSWLGGEFSKDEKLKELQQALAKSASIGPRMMGLAFAWVFVPESGRRLEPALARVPRLFDELDKAKDTRNLIIHPDDSRSEGVDVGSFRHRLLYLASAVMRMDRAQ